MGADKGTGEGILQFYWQHHPPKQKKTFWQQTYNLCWVFPPVIPVTPFPFHWRKEAVFTPVDFLLLVGNAFTYHKHNWFTLIYSNQSWVSLLSVMYRLIPDIVCVFCAGWEMGFTQIHHPTAPHSDVCHHPGTVFLPHCCTVDILFDFQLNTWYAVYLMNRHSFKQMPQNTGLHGCLLSEQFQKGSFILMFQEELLTGKCTSKIMAFRLACINTLFWIFFPVLV